MARSPFIFCLIAISFFISPTLAFGSVNVPGYARQVMNLAKREPNCAPYPGNLGSPCGILCPCKDAGLSCIAGKCSTDTPAALINPGCKTSADCPDGLDCGFINGGYNETACGARYAKCSTQSECTNEYVCVDAQYNQLVKGRDDYANCDYNDQGQALVCTYNDLQGPYGDSYCQNNDPNWKKGCGASRTGSPVSGVCNGMWTPCDLATPDSPATSCFWGFCIGRTHNGVTNYCTWKPGPCDTDADCDNDLLCGPNGMCGGPGTKCKSHDYCGDPYPCMDNGAGQSYCADYNANLQRSEAKDYDNNSGVGSICDYNNNGDATCGDTSKCGQPRANSDEIGVCGGAGASCSSDSQCATGACNFGNCQPWQALGQQVEDDSCTFQSDCADGLACVDDGFGHATCRQDSSTRARVCQVGWEGACDDDPNYSSCGFAREGSVEYGVCGGRDAACETSADCWTGSCQSNNTCAFGDTPTVALNYRRRLAERRCPKGQTLCPVSSTNTPNKQFIMNGYECIDTQTTIDSCGGCLWGTARPGRDCTDIDGVDEVSCKAGRCSIDSCARGWSASANGTMCIENVRR